MLETARDQAYPWLQQISFFLPNKVGTLERMLDVLAAENVRVCGMTILDAHDHAVVRMIVDRPEKAVKAIEEAGRAVCMSKLLGVAIGDGELPSMFSALLRCEMNVYYTYSLHERHGNDAIIAVHTEEVETATTVLRNAGFVLIGQRDLERDDGIPE